METDREIVDKFGHPKSSRVDSINWDWSQLEQVFQTLLAEDLTPDSIPSWLERWCGLRTVVWEGWSTLKSAEGMDLTDDAAGRHLRRFVDEVLTPFEVTDQALAHKLLSVEDWKPDPDHMQFVRGLRYAEEIAGEENVAIAAELSALATVHGEIGADIRVTIDGREASGPDIDRLMQDRNRDVREAAWRTQAEPWLEQRTKVDDVLLEILAKRRRLTHNSGLPDYRAYRWREVGRLDFTPDDCLRLYDAVATALVPIAAQRYDQRRTALGVGTLRPWDLRIDPDCSAPLQPFDDAESFANGMASVFVNRDRELGELFTRMVAGGYVDLGWRQGKRPGGVERPFPLTGFPFVSVCGDGSELNVGTLVHEMGHAFHDYLTLKYQRFEWHLHHTEEFSELAALAMWWLVEPYLAQEHGGFYTGEEAARNRARLLEELALRSVPRDCLIDAFHHWVHTEASEDVSVEELDAVWAELSGCFEPWIDWTGLEAERSLGWRQDWALFSDPFIGYPTFWPISAHSRSGVTPR